jgi:hypothetical protein
MVFGAKGEKALLRVLAKVALGERILFGSKKKITAR